MDREAQFAKQLAQSRLSYTNSRQRIFKSLNNNKPTSASALAKKLANSVDRATVYRNLRIFERIGVVQRIWLGFKSQYELAELFSPHHHHLTCINCGKVEVLEDAAIENRILALAKRRHFKISDHLLEVSGRCNKCK